MLLPHFEGKKACEVFAIIGGTVGGWTLAGVLSIIASLVAIIVGGMQAYDWIQSKRKQGK